MSYSSLAPPSGISLSAAGTAILPAPETLLPSLDQPSSGQVVAPSPHQQAKQKRRSSKSNKTPTEIRRSSSTPHMRNLALQPSGELSPTADKRRNKLGYHRTSVACGHCRRRKIRCLVANDEPTGRCANCIRLKKECNFFPVEQNPENARLSGGATKDGGTGTSAPSSTSSPRHPSLSGEKTEEFRPPFPGAANAAPSRYAPPPADMDVDPIHVPQPGAMHMPQPPYTYPPAIETQWQNPGILPSSSVAETSPSSSGYWQPSPSTANSTYGSDSNVSGGRTPATMSTTSNLSYGGQHDSHGWSQPSMQPPTRSMSYGNIEGLPHQYSTPGLGIHHDYSRRTSPYAYPTSIDTAPSSLHGSTTLGSNGSAPLSAPILPNQQFTYPPTWHPYSAMQSSGHDISMQPRSMSAQWYQEPGQLDQVQEESGPPMAYSQHAPQGMPPQFYSGP